MAELDQVREHPQCKRPQGEIDRYVLGISDTSAKASLLLADWIHWLAKSELDVATGGPAE
jgi:hypothetical protein